ncbi:hypothetical protein M2347_002525 [Chryseobacterium sp. H1D6B]|uniref:hypothetical protein n=1 Tax=Chryseobacterium sp. H1D6B TaxID=2940588 RepID=UPI0015C69BA9|nr:hypothetical protein [Chryseobacterium sp. H1D6B]MDH6252798.1 hypothetical protein [Chryseobacterium sp. H1D6B]
MKQEIKKSSEIKYSHVYLSELKEVVEMYKKTRADHSYSKQQDISMPLTKHFGLPLIQAVHNNKIIGFASVTFNDVEELEINCFKTEDHELPEFEKVLKKNAEKALAAMYHNDEQRALKLKAYILRIADWLNWCN